MSPLLLATFISSFLSSLLFAAEPKITFLSEETKTLTIYGKTLELIKTNLDRDEFKVTIQFGTQTFLLAENVPASTAKAIYPIAQIPLAKSEVYLFNYFDEGKDDCPGGQYRFFVVDRNGIGGFEGDYVFHCPLGDQSYKSLKVKDEVITIVAPEIDPENSRKISDCTFSFTEKKLKKEKCVPR